MPILNGSVPRAALTRCLRELPNYVILRNEEDLFANISRGGDVDLLVADLELAERTLIRHLGPPVRITRSSYLTAYSYDWGNIDLEPTIEWRGASYLPSELVLENRRFSPRERPVPRTAHEALIAWFASMLWGGFFKERYAPEIRQAVETDDAAFREALVYAAGEKWADRLWRAAADGQPEASAAWVGSLRRAVWWRAWLRSPVRTTRHCLGFVVGQLRLRVEPPVPWIAIVGGDETARASVAQEIAALFARCPYGALQVVDWREPISDAGPIRSWRLLTLATRWLINYWTRWVHLRAKGYILAVEATPSDRVITARSQEPGPLPSLARAWLRWLPTPDLVFLLDSPTKAAVKGQHAGCRVLNGESPASTLGREIQSAIRTWLSDRATADLASRQNTSISSAIAEPSPAPIRTSERQSRGTVTAP